ncbi:MAG: response regulator [Phycisphaerae bacterium]|jgi:PAS domain S-box-containing protein|nr:response regulator [Phycisphaerae bacterium]
MWLSLRWKITLFVVVPIVTVYAVATAFNVYRMHQRTNQAVRRRMTELAYHYSHHLDEHLLEVAQVAKLTAALVEKSQHLTPDELDAWLKTNLEQNPLVYGSAIAFATNEYEPDRRLFVRYVQRDGEKLRAWDPTIEGYDYTLPHQEYWHTPRTSGQAVWTEPYFDEGAGNILMATYSVPFFRNGKFWGVATVDIPLEPLRELVDIGISRNFSFIVLTKNGNCVYSPNRDHINKSMIDIAKRQGRQDFADLVRAIASGQTGVATLPDLETSEDEWVFYAPVKSAQWGLAASVPERTAFADVQEQLAWDIGFVAISLVLIVTGLWIMTVRISRPILKLTDAVTEVAAGNLDVRAEQTGNDEISMLAGAVNEMTAKLSQRERSLRDSEQKYRTLTDNLSQRIFLKDTESVYISCNTNYAADIGVDQEEIAGKTDFDFYPRELAEQYRTDDQQVISSGQTRELEERYVKQGQEFIVQTVKTPVWDDAGNVAGVLGIFWDITDRKRAADERARLEDQLRQARKMEAIGQLAGGIAHDFNNILTAIQGNAELLKLDLPETGTPTRFTDEIIKGANRAADLTKQLLSFARKGKRQVTPVDVHQTITDTTHLLAHSLDRRIELHLELHAAPSIVMGDPTQLQNALLNLGLNARDAMPEGGSLTCSTRNVTLTTEDCSERSYDLTPGQYIEISLADTGVGMDIGTQERIFEPFFTTKEMGKGTGLGLAGVYGCVKSHDGSIHVDSTPASGTTFRILLPLADTDAETALHSDGDEKPVRGTGHILVVDDEESVRNFASTALRNLGYTVSTCCDGSEAVDCYREEHGTIDLVILDLIMPKMSGQDAFREFKKINPDVKVLVASGFSHTEATQQMLNDGALVLLNKPFQISKLSQAVAKHTKNDSPQ